jgi:hypothetical protein
VGDAAAGSVVAESPAEEAKVGVDPFAQLQALLATKEMSFALRRSDER